MDQVLCQVDEIEPGAGLEVLVEGPQGEGGWLGLFLVRGEVRVYRNICPHQGRSLSFAPNEFLLEEQVRLVCPHHGACFDLSTGECISGPCKGAFLQAVEVVVVDGEVRLVRTPG